MSLTAFDDEYDTTLRYTCIDRKHNILTKTT